MPPKKPIWHPPRGRRILSLALCVALFSLSAPEGEAKRLSEFGFSDDRSGVEKLLRNLVDGRADAERRYRELLAALDSDDFDEREAATQELANLPVLDRKALETIAENVPPEAAIRIRRALRANSPERFEEMIKAALDTLVDTEAKGLIELLFGALESSTGIRREDMLKRVGEASRVTATADDIEFLKSALQSENPLVRVGAVEAIVAVAGDAAPDLLVVAVGDADPNVKLAVAQVLSKARRRECLKPMAELLMCESFGVRWRSLDELRRLTGQEFGYYAASDAEERKGPAEKWLAWVEEHGPTAALSFGAEPVDDMVVIFNGEDFTGWEEVRSEDAVEALPPGNNAARLAGWEIDGDGVLGTTGRNRGELRGKERFLNYTLNLDYRIPGGIGDSGIGIFAGDPGDGYLEIQVLDGKSGDLYKIGSLDMLDANGERIRFSSPKLAASNEESGEWNQMQIRVSDGAVEVKVNGTLQNKASGGPKRPSSIVLRNEGSRVDFRNMTLQRH